MFNTFKQYLPLIIGFFIIALIIVFAPWKDIIPLVANINPSTLFLLFTLSITYYLAKTVRFWVMLRALGINKPFFKVMLVYLSAQPVSLLPAGELYRCVLMEKKFGVPIIKTASTVTMQGLIEAVVLVLFSIAGVFMIGRERIPVLIIATLLVILIIALQRNWLVGLPRYLNRLPFVNINLVKARKYISDHQDLLSAEVFIKTFLLSLIPVCCGIAIFYISSHAIGIPIKIAQASIGYSLPVIISGLSFLPGGVGSSEGSSIILLKYVGVATAAAVTITLLLRVFTLGAGLLFGFVAIILSHLYLEDHEDLSTHKS